jgi:hypothetical protein
LAAPRPARATKSRTVRVTCDVTLAGFVVEMHSLFAHARNTGLGVGSFISHRRYQT